MNLGGDNLSEAFEQVCSGCVALHRNDIIYVFKDTLT